MVEPPLADHPAFADAYALLEELAAAGSDYGLSRLARRLLSQAFVELTDSGLDMPAVVPLPEHFVDAENGFDILDGLLVRMLAEAVSLAVALRLTRVRELVAEARASR